MTRMKTVEANLGWWAVAALLVLAAVPVFWLPVLLGGDVITLPTTLAAAALVGLAILVVLRDARRRTFAWMAGLAPVAFVVTVVVHNLEYAITGVEEPTFIIAAIVGAPAMLLAGLAGLAWTAFRNRQAPHAGGGPTTHPA